MIKKWLNGAPRAIPEDSEMASSPQLPIKSRPTTPQRQGSASPQRQSSPQRLLRQISASRDTTKTPEAASRSGSFRRAIKTSIISSANRKSAHILPSTADGERCLAILKVQVIGCQNLPAADLNGKSDPYVVVSLAGQRFKTSPIKKTLNPKYPAKEATFDFPIFLSAIERVGALLEFVVWDKDTIGKDYLCEISLAPEQWFKRKGSDTLVLGFDDKDNHVTSFALASMKKQRSKNKDKSVGTIQLKIGLFKYSSETEADLSTMFAEVLEAAKKAERSVFSTPPSQGLGTIKAIDSPKLDRSDSEASSTTSPTSSPTQSTKSFSNEKFRLNWEGTKVDYDFNTGKDVMGILMLEVKGAEDLPKVKSFLKTGWHMDPFIAVSFGKDVYRTKVVRHDLNPVWGDKFILYVNRTAIAGSSSSIASIPSSFSLSSPPPLSSSAASISSAASSTLDSDSPETSSTTAVSINPSIATTTVVHFSLLDWEKVTRDEHIGDAVLNITSLMDDAPKPDPETGLFSEEAMRLHPFTEFKLPVTIRGGKDKEKWEGQFAPVILVRAKYDHHSAMRQRFWRNHLKQHDADHSGQYSRDELVKTLESVRVFTLDDLTTEKVNAFFAPFDKDPEKDELTIEEAMFGLEGEFGEHEQQQRIRGPRPRPVKPRSSMFGHSRESLYDLHQQLEDLFTLNPASYAKEGGATVIPASAVLSVLAAFSELHDGVALMEETEEAQLAELLKSVPDVEITPDFLIEFIAKATAGPVVAADAEPETPTESGTATKQPSPLAVATDLVPTETDDLDRMQSPDQDYDLDSSGYYSRASSPDSVITSFHIPGASTRRTPGGSASLSQLQLPVAPSTPKTPSPFDIRQRTTPLEAVAPSSFRPTPAFKRRRSSGSVNGGKAMSDTDASPSVSSFSFSDQPRSRARAPSNPASPSPRLPAFSFPTRKSVSRPTSPTLYTRAGSHSAPTLPTTGFHSLRKGPPSAYSPEHGRSPSAISNLPLMDHNDHRDHDNALDSGSDDEHRVGQSEQSSSQFATVPMSSADSDALEALQKANADLSKKLQENERSLQQRMAAHEADMEDLQVQLQEVQEELQATKKEEKDLKIREHSHTMQLATLEAEVSKLQRMLETSQTSYSNMQRQYNEQCAESERYRNVIRQKDIDLKASEENADMTASEATKWRSAYESAEAAITTIMAELEVAREAQHNLDSQKQENLLLKETIDRLRFDLDEMRTTAAAASSSRTSLPGSNTGTMTRDLAHELQDHLHDVGPNEEGSDNDSEGESTEGEDYVETIITRRKKLNARGKRGDLVVAEEVKEYSDASAQHDSSEFTSSMTVQTDAMLERRLATTETQTDVVEAPVPEDEVVEELPESSPGASSSSPAPVATSPVPNEAPPSYARLLEEEREKIGLAELARWHPSGDSGDLNVSTDAVAEWARVKAELGMSCLAIDRAFESATVTGPRAVIKAPEVNSSKQQKRTLFSRDDFMFYGGVAMTVIGLLLLSSLLRTVFPAIFSSGPIAHDRRMWDIYNDFALAGGRLDGLVGDLRRGPQIPRGTSTSSLARFSEGARRFGWVPS